MIAGVNGPTLNKRFLETANKELIFLLIFNQKSKHNLYIFRMTSFKPDFSTCHTVTLTEKCQEICMQSTTTVKHISSNNFCKLSDILSTMLILSVFGLCLNHDLYLWWMIINICSIIVIYVFQTFSDDRKSSIQINSNINTTNNNTNNNTNKTSNNKPAIEPMLKMFNALNINNDEHKYNYKALHPAYKLINEYGWDIFHTNLVNTVIDQKGLSIRNDRDFPQTNYQLFHYYVSYVHIRMFVLSLVLLCADCVL